MLDFQVPRISAESADDTRGSFTIEPLDRGFGYTFGNSLRRVLLSSLAGAAVTSVRIEGVAHEFSTIQGVKEDVTDIVLNLKGERCLTDKCGVERRSYPPGEHGRGRMKQSEYRIQLREKQKARRYYGVLERQFRGYYDKASRQPGITGENLLALLECRLDNVLVRLGFAASRRQARQLIRHGHWTVNGRRVNIPSYQVRPGDVVAIKADTPATQVVRDATELTGQIPAWLQADHESLTAKVLRKPERREVAAPVQEQLIVELYSK